MRILGVKEMMWITMVVSLVIGFAFFEFLNLDWMLLIYGLGVVIVGVVVFMGDWEPSFTVKDKKLGASYWGRYQDSAEEADPEKNGINPPKPCKGTMGLAGSGMYAKGSPVTSAK